MITRVDVQLVGDPVNCLHFAVGTGVEDWQLPNVDRADAIAPGLEVGQRRTGAGGLRACRLLRGSYRSGLDREAGGERDRRARRTDEFMVTRKVGRAVRPASTAGQVS